MIFSRKRSGSKSLFTEATWIRSRRLRRLLQRGRRNSPLEEDNRRIPEQPGVTPRQARKTTLTYRPQSTVKNALDNSRKQLFTYLNPISEPGEDVFTRPSPLECLQSCCEKWLGETVVCSTESTSPCPRQGLLTFQSRLKEIIYSCQGNSRKRINVGSKATRRRKQQVGSPFTTRWLNSQHPTGVNIFHNDFIKKALGARRTNRRHTSFRYPQRRQNANPSSLSTFTRLVHQSTQLVTGETQPSVLHPTPNLISLQAAADNSQIALSSFLEGNNDPSEFLQLLLAYFVLRWRNILSTSPAVSLESPDAILADVVATNRSLTRSPSYSRSFTPRPHTHLSDHQ